MPQEKVKVRVIVSGGVVQHVECGDFVEVTVCDYDCDGCDADSLSTDEDGKQYVESVW